MNIRHFYLAKTEKMTLFAIFHNFQTVITFDIVGLSDSYSAQIEANGVVYCAAGRMSPDSATRYETSPENVGNLRFLRFLQEKNFLRKNFEKRTPDSESGAQNTSIWPLIIFNFEKSVHPVPRR